MKRSLLAISAVFILGSVMGCATRGDIEKVQAQEQQTNLKADQALQGNEAAMKAVDASNQKADQALRAAQQANDAARAAEERAQAAEARAQAAEAKAAQKSKADAAFRESMKK